MSDVQRRVDEVRRRRNAIQNNLIDEYVAAKMGRREFIRRGTVFGLSVPTLGFLVAACGANDGGESAATTAGTGATTGGGTETTAAARQGGTLRVAINVPAGAVDPVTVNDPGGLCLLGQTGEYLAWSQNDLTLRPVLAESWEPLDGGRRWRFALRQGVKFHDGQTMTANDVVATIDRLADPANSSNALSAFQGVLQKGNSKAVDDTTVEFNLDAPNGNFPYLVSSDNYNAIILPANYAGNFEQNFNGTGPFRLDSFTPKARASFVRNDDYWGDPALLDRTEFTFYAEEGPQITALQARQVDVVNGFAVASGRAILDNPAVTVKPLKSVAHRQIHIRTDQGPFTDKRVRQAMGLLVDRDALVQGLFEGKADLGNDSPCAPAFPSTDPSVPQRTRDVARAKALLAEAGQGGGFTAQVNALRRGEIPDLAQLMQQNVKEAGINLEIVVQDSSTYYGEAVFGQSPWLDSTIGITEYGHRGVPNVFLNAPLRSDGTWNSAHFKNPQYDRLVDEYTAAVEVDAERRVADQIQELLLDETPVIIPYFYNSLSANQNNVTGTEPTAMSHLNLAEAGFTG